MINKIDRFREETEGVFDLDEIVERCNKTEHLKEFRKSLEFDEKANSFDKILESDQAIFDGVRSVINTFDNSEALAEKLLKSDSVLDFIIHCVNEKVSDVSLANSFVHAAMIARDQLVTHIKYFQIDVEKDDNKNRLWIERNKYLQYLALIGIIPPVTYDEIHKRGIYNFSSVQKRSKTKGLSANEFAYDLVGNKDYPLNIIRDKKVVELCSGSGNDAAYFVSKGEASTVELVDSSDFIFEVQKGVQKKIRMLLRNRFKLLEKSTDIISYLHNLAEKVKLDSDNRVDTFFSISGLHLFSTSDLKLIIALIRDCLVDEGFFALALKAPNARLDNKKEGICLINDVHQYDPGDRPRIYERMWVNHDGLVRVYRDGKALMDLIEACGFLRIKKTTTRVGSYAIDGDDQDFYNFIFQKTNLTKRSQKWL